MRAHYTNVYASSAECIRYLLELHFPEGSILDVTYGLGVFYKEVQRRVTGFDLLSTGNIVGDNRQLPLRDQSFDIGVLDPPYKRGDGVRYEHRYGKAPHTEQQVTRSYYEALPELLRVCRQGLIIKVQDGTDGHRFYPRHIEVCNYLSELAKIRLHDVAIVVRNGVPDVMAQGVQHFFMQRMSYFLVFKWRDRSYRPVIF
jgi:hypothetical protein